MAKKWEGEIYGDNPWFTAHMRKEAPHETLGPLVTQLREQQRTLRDNTRRLISIYQFGYKAGQLAETDDVAIGDEVNAYNVARNTIDTVWAKVCKTRIAPMALTEGAGYLARRRARKLSQALEGELEESRIEEIKEDVVMDAYTTDHGAGAAKVYQRHGRIQVDWVPIEDLTIDPAESRLRRPRSLFQTMTMDRYVAMADFGCDDPGLYGKREARRQAIRQAPRATDVVHKSYSSEHHQIEIIEAWHLPSRPADSYSEDELLVEEDEDGNEYRRLPAHDGRHVIMVAGVDGGTLVDEPWERDRFPIVLFVPRKRRRSIYGISLMRAMAPSQREYEKITERIQLANHRIGGTHTISPRSANVTERELDNGQGTHVEYDGNVPPKEWNPTPVNPQTYDYQDRLARDIMVRAGGQSEFAVSSQVPSGLSQASGKALQVFEDQEDVRLLPDHKALERWYVDVCWLLVDEAEALSKKEPEYAAKFRGKNSVERLPWRELLEDKRDFVLKVFPISNLAKQPAAKFAQLMEMLNAGAITVEQFKRLFGFPDLEAENELDLADVDVIDMTLDKIAIYGEYLTPEPFDNLDALIARAGKFYNMMRVKGELPEDRMELLRQFISDAQDLADKAKAAAAPPAPAPGPLPPPSPMGAPPDVPPPPPGGGEPMMVPPEAAAA